MASNEDENIDVSDYSDALSDDSSFYGTPKEKERLEARAAAFDPAAWWAAHPPKLNAITHRGRESQQISPVNETGNVSLQDNQLPAQLSQVTPTFNHNQSSNSSLLPNETLAEFFARLPPDTVPARESIHIDNPLSNLPIISEENRESFKQAGEAILEKLKSVAYGCKTSEARLDRQEAVDGILRLARESGITSGKWMVFASVGHITELWPFVATKTLGGGLGFAARVNTQDNQTTQVLLIYTDHFDDLVHFRAVLKVLVDLIEDLGFKNEVRRIHYKPEAFSILGIRGGNKWGLGSTLYSRSSIEAQEREERETTDEGSD